MLHHLALPDQIVLGYNDRVEAISVLREFGFPIFVCVWFMYRLEKKIDGLLQQQAQVHLAIIVLAQVLEVDLPPQFVLPRRGHDGKDPS